MSKKKFTPLSTEHDQTHTYLPEEFAEGAYGAPDDEPLRAERKKEDARPAPRFAYEAKGLHEGIPRQFPGAHPIDDDPKKSKQGPYGPGIGSTEMD